MKRLALAFLAGVAGAGIVTAFSGAALAEGAGNAPTQNVAPISSNAPDVVALDAAASSAPDIVGTAPAAKDGNAKVKLKTVSSSIVALVGPPPAPSQKKRNEGAKTRLFDPGPMVIRAGLIGDGTPAAPVEISDTPATGQPRITEDGHQPSPQDGDTTSQTGDQNPDVSPK